VVGNCGKDEATLGINKKKSEAFNIPKG